MVHLWSIPCDRFLRKSSRFRYGTRFAMPSRFMVIERVSEWQAPIFILADDDRGAVDRITELLHPEWYYITVTQPKLVTRYAKRVPVAAVFLADPIEYPNGGTAALLQRLIDEVQKPVIILAEHWTLEAVDQWKRMGAEDCLPHPTRFHERLETLRAKMQSHVLASGKSGKVCRQSEKSQR